MAQEPAPPPGQGRTSPPASMDPGVTGPQQAVTSRSRGSSSKSPHQSATPWRRRAVLAAVPLAAAGGYLGWRANSAGGRDSETASSQLAITEFAAAERGEPLTLAGPGLGGEALDVTDYRGQVVVINVWGSWCAPCRLEAPVLQANAVAYAEQGVRFLGVNVQDSPAAARAFERTYAITYPSIDDSVNADALLTLRRHIPPSGIPSTLVLDVQGRVAARVIGAVSDVTLRSLLDAVLSEQAAERSPTDSESAPATDASP